MLFDGKDLSKWESSRSGEAKWKVENGYMEAVKGTGAIYGQTPPLGIREEAASSEPLGSLLALLLGLYEEDVRGVYARGGLVGFQSVLSSSFLCLPHDVVIPGALTASDFSVLAAGLAPRPLALVGLVDGLNRAVDRKTAEAAYEHTSRAYQAANVRNRFVVAGAEDAPAPGPWLLSALKDK